MQEILKKVKPVKYYVIGDTREDIDAGHKIKAVKILIRSNATPKIVPNIDKEINFLSEYLDFLDKDFT
jgi:phosphoglycolate phosphatase-like HAD superfamily hydrolase